MVSGGNPLVFRGPRSFPAVASADVKHSIILLSRQLRVYYVQTRQCVLTVDVDLREVVAACLDLVDASRIVCFTKKDVFYVVWKETVARAVELEPDSVTIYQMEIPFNTTIYREMKAAGKLSAPVADWATKRRWVTEAFARLEQAGYELGSGYTASKPGRARFLYRGMRYSARSSLNHPNAAMRSA